MCHKTRILVKTVPKRESYWSRMCRNESYWSRRCRNESLGQGGAHDQFVPSQVFFTHFQTNALGLPMDSPSALFFHSFAMMPNALRRPCSELCASPKSPFMAVSSTPASFKTSHQHSATSVSDVISAHGGRVSTISVSRLSRAAICPGGGQDGGLGNFVFGTVALFHCARGLKGERLRWRCTGDTGIGAALGTIGAK